MCQYIQCRLPPFPRPLCCGNGRDPRAKKLHTHLNLPQEGDGNIVLLRVKKSIFPESGQNLCVTWHKWQNYPTFFALLFFSTTTILIALYYSKGSWTLDTSSSSSSFLLPLAITLFTATLGRLGTRGGGPPPAANSAFPH